MFWPATISALGSAASLVSGFNSSSLAEDQLEFAKQQFALNQQIGGELKDRWNRLVEPILESQMAEAKSKNLTQAGREATESLTQGIGKLKTKVTQAVDDSGGALTDARLLNLDLNQAKGVAGIRLSDETTKRETLGNLMTFASQTPSWASVMTGANNQMGQFSANLGFQSQQAAASAYGAAAEGISDLARMWGRYDYLKAHPNANPELLYGGN